MEGQEHSTTALGTGEPPIVTNAKIYQNIFPLQMKNFMIGDGEGQ